MDLSKLSDADLMALKGGDLSKVSTEGLMSLKSSQEPVKTGVDAIPTGGYPKAPEKQQPSFGELMRGQVVSSMPSRFLTGMAAPALALQEAVAPAGSQSWSKAIRDEQAKGDIIKGPIERGFGTGAEIYGNIANPVSQLAMRAMPIASGAKGILPKAIEYAKNVGVGAGTGAALGLTNPVGTTGEETKLSDLVTGKKPESYWDKKVQQAKEGAAGGAVASGVIAPAISLGAKGAGKVIDFLTGNSPAVNAGKIARDIAGPKLDEIRAANAAAPDNLTAAQAAHGVDRDVWSALGQTAEKKDPNSFYRVLTDKQEAARIDELRRLAGGATQTEARQARDISKKTLNDITSPMREVELSAANTAGKVQADLIPKVQQKQEAMISALQQNMGKRPDVLPTPVHAGTESAQSAVRFKEGKPGWISNADRSKEWSETADIFSVIKGQRQTERDFIQSQIDSLSAHGLNPLNTGKMIGAIESKLNDPRVGVDDVNKRVLTKVSKKIQEWTERSGGVIDANALYEIRKSVVNNEVERLMRGADPTAQAKRAAGILKEVRPLIDDAIETAGGTGWRNYLSTFEQGMKSVGQKKMGATLLETYEKSPEQFSRIAAGDEPKIVEKVFGANQFDIKQEMGDKYKVISKILEERTRDKQLAERAASGTGGLKTILEKDQWKFRFPALFSRPATVANKALDVAETNINAKTMELIVEGMKSGKSANEMLSKLPLHERNKIIKAMTDYKAAPALVSGQNALQGER